MNNNVIKKDNDSKKIFGVIIMVLTLMICTTSATYAWFAISASANNSISGAAAAVNQTTYGYGLDFADSSGNSAAPTYIAPATTTYQSKPMVPQISYTSSTNVLQKAFTGASGKDKCVDANGNVICKAYTFTIKNTTDAAVDVRGYIQFTFDSDSTFTNLRWKLMTSATAVTVSTATGSSNFSTTAPVIASTSKIYFDTTNVALAANGGTKQYWLIVWIEETNANQNTTDVGTWYGTIGFDAFNESGTSIGGITSTITS